MPLTHCFWAAQMAPYAPLYCPDPHTPTHTKDASCGSGAVAVEGPFTGHAPPKCGGWGTAPGPHSDGGLACVEGARVWGLGDGGTACQRSSPKAGPLQSHGQDGGLCSGQTAPPQQHIPRRMTSANDPPPPPGELHGEVPPGLTPPMCHKIGRLGYPASKSGRTRRSESN